jgi:HAD superfamily hydrolase (TIGR01509 family)
MQEAVLMPGAHYALAQSKKHGCITAIVSSGDKKYLDLVIAQFNFDRWLDFIVTGNDVKKGKPDPECYSRAFQSAHERNPDLTSHDCLVFEDTEAGVTAGKAANMKVVFVPTPVAIHPTNPLPDFTLSSLNDISDTQFS